MGQGLLPLSTDRNRVRRAARDGGMPLLLELACATGLWASVRYHVDVCSENQGWTDEQIVLASSCSIWQRRLRGRPTDTGE